MRMHPAIVLAVSLFAGMPTFSQVSSDRDSSAASGLPDDIVEISPDLFLLVQRTIRQNPADMQVAAIRRANEFAAKRGGVVVPISGDYGQFNIAQRVYRYQFRVTSREQALALQPVLSESLITVHNTGGCAPPGNAIAALGALAPEQTLRMVAVPPLLIPGLGSDPAGPGSEPLPPAICFPGHICSPSQMCLPGWQCSPGMPPVPESAPVQPTPPTASLR